MSWTWVPSEFRLLSLWWRELVFVFVNLLSCNPCCMLFGVVICKYVLTNIISSHMSTTWQCMTVKKVVGHMNILLTGYCALN